MVGLCFLSFSVIRIDNEKFLIELEYILWLVYLQYDKYSLKWKWYFSNLYELNIYLVIEIFSYNQIYFNFNTNYISDSI